MSNEEPTRESITRRGVLKGTAAAAGTAAFAGRSAAELIDGPIPDVQDETDGRTLLLLGIVGGWQGIGPAEIDGVSNPTLRLPEGEEHQVVWINGDGSHHNFNVRAEEDEIVEATALMDNAGEFQEVPPITGDPELTEYFCAPHPVQMRGPIEVIDAEETHELRVVVEGEDGDPLPAEVYLDDQHAFSSLAARPSGPEEPFSLARFDLLEDGDYTLEAWTFGHQRVTEEVTIDGSDEEVSISLPETDPGEPAETFSLRLEEDRWVGQEPDAIADEENPTLELEADETYEVEIENAIGRRLDEGEMAPGEPLPGHNFVIAEGGEVDMWNTHVRSGFLSEEGETETVQFVAKEGMGVYLDQSQLNAFGEVDVS